MPLPKSLRRPVIRASSSAGLAQRKRCHTCNNLDPRGHGNSVYASEAAKEPTARLDLVLDALALARTKPTDCGGCRFCNVLVQTLDAFFQKWRGARRRVNVSLKEKGTIKVSIDGERWKGEIVEIYAGSASRAPWPSLGSAHTIPNNAGSDETFTFVRRCIQGCLANPNHTACRFSSEASISAPKRLLDVGRVSRSEPVRLIDTQGKRYQYVALSHCWGSTPQFTVTKSTWAKMSVKIAFEALPPLFQDAVIITRQLGLRYIWIDSLCIIQDSLRDWETESLKMGNIYQNSYVTISATSSHDGSIRCLTDRRKAVKIQYENTTRKTFDLRARRILDHHPDSDGGPARPMGPLTFRAWALQEHVLSSRILHYTATELMFECKTSYRCECMPERKTRPTTPALIPKAVASKKKHAIWDTWHRIVEQYSTRDLTVPGDKLPAISGIACKIRKATHSEYLAGLWKVNLASDLLWQRSSPVPLQAHRHALETWRAPSFSWSSLNAPITYYTPNDDERETFKSSITLVASSVTPTGFNTLGSVTDASLTLRGPTIPAILCAKQNGDDWDYTLLVKERSAIQVSYDCCLVDAEMTTDSGAKRRTVHRAKQHQTLTEFQAPVLCLSVARYDAWLTGLVLGESECKPGSWERLGLFSIGGEAFRHTEDKEVKLC